MRVTIINNATGEHVAEVEEPNYVFAGPEALAVYWTERDGTTQGQQFPTAEHHLIVEQ